MKSCSPNVNESIRKSKHSDKERQYIRWSSNMDSSGLR